MALRSFLPWSAAPGRIAVACALVVGSVPLAAGCSSDTPTGRMNATFKVTLQGVQDGQTIAGIVNVTAVVSGATSIPAVTFLVGETRVDTVMAPPYTSAIDTRKFPEGPTIISAVAATDPQNQRTGLAKVTIDNTGPTVDLTEPSLFWNEAPISLHLDVKDTAGIANLVVKAAGIPLTVSPEPYIATLDLAALSITPESLPVDLELRVEASDTVFNQTIKTQTVRLAPRLAWRFDTLGEVWSAPIFGPDGAAYFGSRDKKAYAVNANGSARWSTLLAGEVVNTPGFDPSTGRSWYSSGSAVAVLDSAGKSALSWAAPTTVSSAPVVNKELVYVGVFDGQLRALSRSGAGVAWAFTATGPIEGTPVMLANDVVAFGSDDRFVYAVDATGKQVWKFETGGKVWGVTAARNGDVLVGSYDGYLYRLDPLGTKRWQFQGLGQIWGAPSEAADGTIYFTSVLGKLYAVDANGTKKWEQPFPGFQTVSPAVSSAGTIYVADSDGVVHALQPDGSELWSYKTGGPVKGSVKLSPDESMAVVGSDDRRVYALNTGEGACPLPQMVTVNGVSIMKYEASRVDATAAAEGTKVATACSRPGVKPWTNVNFAEAQAACNAISLDLCPAVAWEAACRGPSQADYPYGAAYVAASCAGKDNAGGGCAGGACAPMATGANAACVSAAGIYDASGNVREWTLQADGANRMVRGGSVQDAAADLLCSSVTPARHSVAPATRAADIGFRCCKP